MLHDGDLGWHENTTGGFNQLLDKQLHHFLSHVLCVICCDFLILGPEFDMYWVYFLPEETTLLYANLLSPFNFWLEIHFLRCSPNSSPLPFSNLIPSTWPYWSLVQGLGSSCLHLHPWKLTAGTPSMQVWFRWFSRTKEVIFRSYVSFRGGEYLQRFSTFKSEFTPLPNHQSPINAALTLQLPSSCADFFFGVLLAIPAIFFAQPSFEDRFCWIFRGQKVKHGLLSFVGTKHISRPSMYGIFTLGKYTIHGWYGIVDGSEIGQSPINWYRRLCRYLQGLGYIKGGCLGFLNHQQYEIKKYLICCLMYIYNTVDIKPETINPGPLNLIFVLAKTLRGVHML